MADATTPNNPVVEHQPRRQRRRYTDEFKQQLVALCQSSGESVAGIALEHQINANLLRRWVKAAEQSDERPELLPISVFGQSHGTLEIQLDSATIRVQGSCDPAVLTTAIQALR